MSVGTLWFFFKKIIFLDNFFGFQTKNFSAFQQKIFRTLTKKFLQFCVKTKLYVSRRNFTPKIFEFISFFGLWEKNFGIGRKIQSRVRETAFYVCNITFYFFFKEIINLDLFSFRTFGKKFAAKLSKLNATCPEETFFKKGSFFNFVRLWVKSFGRGREVQSRVGKTAFYMSRKTFWERFFSEEAIV